MTVRSHICADNNCNLNRFITAVKRYKLTLNHDKNFYGSTNIKLFRYILGLFKYFHTKKNPLSLKCNFNDFWRKTFPSIGFCLVLVCSINKFRLRRGKVKSPSAEKSIMKLDPEHLKPLLNLTVPNSIAALLRTMGMFVYYS